MIIIGEKVNQKVSCEEHFNGDKYEISFIDMGIYVGHKERRWFQRPKSCWKPMFAEITTKEGNQIHYETLVDDQGRIMRIILEEAGCKRVTQFKMQLDENFEPKNLPYEEICEGKETNPDLKIWDEEFVNTILENLIEAENQFKLAASIENEE